MIHPDHASLLIYKYQEKVKSKLSFILLIYPFCFHPANARFTMAPLKYLSQECKRVFLMCLVTKKRNKIDKIFFL